MKFNYFIKHLQLVSISKFLLISLIFGLAYTQDPIYNSAENQNTKFLHGLANAGYGLLSEDWFANTIDPLPAFTWLIENTYRYIHAEYMFYVYYFLFFGIYVFSILAISDYIYDLKKSSQKLIVYLTAFIFIHTVHLKIFHFDIGEDLHYGVAKQYVLGPVFQPSTFGVFIILSIYCALKSRYFLAVFLLALAATFHPTYLPSAAILTLSYQILIFKREKNLVKIILVGLLSLGLILPVLSYSSSAFTPTNLEFWSKAQEIIVQLRIPHHSLPQFWLKQGGYKTYIQALLVVCALWLIRKNDLFSILLFPFVLAVLATILQLLINNDTIAFIAPWRVSIFLMPISTSIILAEIISLGFQKYPLWLSRNQQLIVRISVVIISILVIAGTIEQLLSFGYGGVTTNEMMDFVKNHKQSGETYLIPPDQIRLYKFRLHTGAAIFINNKTHPYKDIEVLEWYDRLEKAEEFYQQGDRSCQILEDLVPQYSITHVVLDQDSYNLTCKATNEVYRNRKYRIMKIEN